MNLAERAASERAVLRQHIAPNPRNEVWDKTADFVARNTTVYLRSNQSAPWGIALKTHVPWGQYAVRHEFGRAMPERDYDVAVSEVVRLMARGIHATLYKIARARHKRGLEPI